MGGELGQMRKLNLSPEARKAHDAALNAARMARYKARLTPEKIEANRAIARERRRAKYALLSVEEKAKLNARAREAQRQAREANPERSRAWARVAYEKARSSEDTKKKRNQYSRDYVRRRARESLGFRIKSNLRSRLYSALRGKSKSDRTLALIGCSVEFLILHIESKLKPGMTWDNYGPKGWHIDHIRPCASFDLTDPNQQKQCFNFNNLQPLWALENFAKNRKYVAA